MSYHNFAGNGYVVLNPSQPGAWWHLAEGASVVFEVSDAPANRASMRFTRPPGAPERIDAILGLGVAGGGGATRGTPILVILNLLRGFGQMTDPTPVERSTHFVGIGYDDGHVGSRERSYDDFVEAVSERGQAWLGKYREYLSCGPFFVGSDRWWEWGAIATDHGLMKIRYDIGARLMEVMGFMGEDPVRIVQSVIEEKPPEFRQRYY